nr:putative ribonuclease H-like domain-containing protein [Tanacetum cinerariifolium]
MIGALMYLTSSRPDIVHATCLCAWYQAKPIEKHLKEVKRIFRYLRGTVNMGLGTITLSWKPCQGGSSKLNLPGHRISRWRYNLTPAESKFKTPILDHQDKNMMKAQVHVSKSSANSDVQPPPQRKHYCQIYQVVKHRFRGRLLASFQDHEHEGGDTRSQGGIKDNDVKIQIQDHSMHMIPQRNSQEQGSKFQERGTITLSWKPCQGGSFKLNLPGHRISRWRYNLTPAESKFMTPMLDHQDKNMMKAQVHVSKSSANSDLQPPPQRKHYCQIYQVAAAMDCWGEKRLVGGGGNAAAMDCWGEKRLVGGGGNVCRVFEML